MNYSNFAERCKEYGYSPSGLVKELGISDGNLNRWKKGGNPSPAVLEQLMNKLNCTSDFLLGMESVSVSPKNLLDSEIQSLKALPQRVASLKHGGTVGEIDELTKYFRCEPGYLFRTENVLYKTDESKSTLPDRNVEYRVMDILDRFADSEDYRILQIQISRIILYWLRQADEAKFNEVMADKRLSQGKINFLLSGKESRYSSENYGLNLSDVLFLRSEFDVSFSYMFIGAE